MTRWSRFAQVGAMGFAAQLVILHVTTVLVPLPYALAIILSVEAAILHNFLWHERWTWRDRVAGSTAHARIARLLRFNLVSGGLSLFGNVALTLTLINAANLPVLPANVAAAGCLSVVNFLLADRLTFQMLPEKDNSGQLSAFSFQLLGAPGESNGRNRM